MVNQMPDVSQQQVLDIERQIIEDERKNDELILRFREIRDTTRTRYITLAIAIGAFVVPVVSAVDSSLDRAGLRWVVTLLTIAIVVALLGSVAENVASVRRAKLAQPKERAAFKQLVKWRMLGTPFPPDDETKIRRAADDAYAKALELEARIYRASDVITVGLITTAMLKLTAVFLWS